MSDSASPAPLLYGVGGLYLTGEDSLRVNSWGSASGVTLAIEGRQLSCEGGLVPLAETHTPNSDRTLKQSLITLGPGWLTGVQVRVASGTVKRGQCFVELELVRGRLGNVQSLGVLAAAYVASAGRVAWPGSGVQSPLDGPGVLLSITGTDPAAGAEISETVPTGARWRLAALFATIVTSGTVASRGAELVFDDGANAWLRASPNLNVPASSTAGYSWAAYGNELHFLMSCQNVVIPPDAVLSAGSRIRTVTVNLDSGDNWGAPQYLVEEWIEP